MINSKKLDKQFIQNIRKLDASFFIINLNMLKFEVKLAEIKK